MNVITPNFHQSSADKKSLDFIEDILEVIHDRLDRDVMTIPEIESILLVMVIHLISAQNDDRQGFRRYIEAVIRSIRKIVRTWD
jgi:hypothetical protein